MGKALAACPAGDGVAACAACRTNKVCAACDAGPTPANKACAACRTNTCEAVNVREALKDITAKATGEFGTLGTNGDGFRDESEMAAPGDKAERNPRRRSGDNKEEIDTCADTVKNPQFADNEATCVHSLALDLMKGEHDAMKKTERNNPSKFTKTENEEGMPTTSCGGPGDDEIKETREEDDADSKETETGVGGLT